jgi:ATP phosphoribosyltransferase
VVDITTTGATLEANGLKVLDDGLILRSQAQLAASLRAKWTPGQMATAEALLRQVEARAAARSSATLTWPATNGAAEAVVADLVAQGASRRPNGLLVAAHAVADAGRALSRAGLGPVTAAQPDFVFETDSLGWSQLKAALQNN